MLVVRLECYPLSVSLGVPSGALRRMKLIGTVGLDYTSALVILGMLSYSAFHAMSYGPVTWVVVSEIFPAAMKGRLQGMATTANRLASFMMASRFLTLSEKTCWSGAFLLYASFAIASFFFYLLFVPETKGMALEDITPLFARAGILVKTNLGLLSAASRKSPGVI